MTGPANLRYPVQTREVDPVFDVDPPPAPLFPTALRWLLLGYVLGLVVGLVLARGAFLR